MLFGGKDKKKSFIFSTIDQKFVEKGPELTEIDKFVNFLTYSIGNEVYVFGSQYVHILTDKNEWKEAYPIMTPTMIR